MTLRSESALFFFLERGGVRNYCGGHKAGESTAKMTTLFICGPVHKNEKRFRNKLFFHL